MLGSLETSSENAFMHLCYNIKDMWENWDMYIEIGIFSVWAILSHVMWTVESLHFSTSPQSID